MDRKTVSSNAIAVEEGLVNDTEPVQRQEPSRSSRRNQFALAAIACAVSVIVVTTIGMTQLVRHRIALRESSSTGNDWEEAPAPACGSWAKMDARLLAKFDSQRPAGSERNTTLAYACSSNSVIDTMKASKKVTEVTEASCEAWCKSAHKPVPLALATKRWCCAMSSGSCAWTDGFPRAEIVPLTAAKSSALAICRTPGAGEYVCPDKTLHDAIKVDGDGPGLCSQICLPAGLIGIAMKQGGVTRGSCLELGYATWEYLAVHAGVKYNVYSK